MQLQTNKSSRLTIKPVNLTNSIIGILLIGIPAVVALCISKPDILTTLKASGSEIFKGIVMGISTLPICLFVGLKGGLQWYKKIWCWAVVILMLAAVLGIVFLV